MRAALLVALALTLGACAPSAPTAAPAPPPLDPALDGAPEAASASAVGAWAFTVRTPIGDQRGVLDVTGEPGALAATIGAEGGQLAAQTVTQTGDRLVVRYADPQRGASTIEARLVGGRLDGTLAVQNLGTFPLTATRRVN